LSSSADFVVVVVVVVGNNHAAVPGNFDKLPAKDFST
jgi:hypothetical protein